MFSIDAEPGNPDFFGSFDDDFTPACANNDLPPYSFLELRFANSPGGLHARFIVFRSSPGILAKWEIFLR